MTITSLIPGRREQRKHRVHDALRHEKSEAARLSKALDEATCKLVALATEIDELRAERTKLARKLDTAQIDLGEARHDLHTAGKEQERLQAALKAWEARWANAHPVNVPAPRDLRPSDERPTVPTDVSSIRAVHRVVPISERPAPDADTAIKCPAPSEAATPSHVPTWAIAGETGPTA